LLKYEAGLELCDTGSKLFDDAVLLAWVANGGSDFERVLAALGGGTERGIWVEGSTLKLQIPLKAGVGVVEADSVLAQDVGGRDWERSRAHGLGRREGELALANERLGSGCDLLDERLDGRGRASGSGRWEWLVLQRGEHGERMSERGKGANWRCSWVSVKSRLRRGEKGRGLYRPS
jgi:hypothetical protein